MGKDPTTGTFCDHTSDGVVDHCKKCGATIEHRAAEMAAPKPAAPPEKKP